MTAAADLAGRLTVVSGAGGGIGAGLAREAVSRGMKVLALDVDAARLAALAGSLPRDAVRTAVVDVADAEAVAAAASEATAAWGPAALICCNAGIEFAGRTWDMTPDQWRRLQGINVDGAFHLLHAFLPATIADGRPGHVLVTSSVGGLSSGAG
ncbi:SDR family NAD(P)-dependent oxidoreductase [Nocardioides immobilis]|uniref:SDR family NAD(P)-dependent oxidoreductase n=1 Tax=Nocardioides immobilis TaxID=2049295 RepID=UPI0015F7964C|nr:SDR family NAD(P)-dependent oxidoreductase [Nocardioides immobilis]